MIPCHYDTFPPIETDAEAFKSDVEQRRHLEVAILEPGETHSTMTHAIVLIEAERDALATLGGELADLEGVAEAYSVTGEWDFVAILRVARPRAARRGRHRQLVELEGVARTPDDGRLRGLLPARPRGAVLHRSVSA